MLQSSISRRFGAARIPETAEPGRMANA